MKDLIFFDGYYFPPFLGILLLALAVWGVVRLAYVKVLYNRDIWHPSLCDFCIFTIIQYFIMQYFLGVL